MNCEQLSDGGAKLNVSCIGGVAETNEISIANLLLISACIIGQRPIDARTLALFSRSVVQPRIFAATAATR
jgi:hypothetical protein